MGSLYVLNGLRAWMASAVEAAGGAVADAVDVVDAAGSTREKEEPQEGFCSWSLVLGGKCILL